MEPSEQHIVDKVIARLIENDLETFKNLISQAQTTKSTNMENSVSENFKIKEKITELVNRKYSKPKPNSKGYDYKAKLRVNGPSDILHNIANILSMCIITLDSTDTGPNPNLPKYINIQYSLDLILQLLPFEEVECLEEIIEVYNLTYDISSGNVEAD